MSVPAKKIVVKKPAVAAAAKSKVVVKTSAAPAATKKIVQKVVMVPQIVEEVEEEEAPKTAQQIYDEIQVLLAQLVQVSGGKKKGFKKDGTPRAKRTNTSGWNAYVTEFRAENPGVSWKDAMVLCKESWAALKGEVAPEDEEDVSSVAAAPAPAPAPAPAKKLVIAKSGAKTAQVSLPLTQKAAAAPPAKTAAELMAEAMALAEAEKAKAEAEAAGRSGALLEAPEVEVEEFEWEGQTLQKNAEGFCWRVDEEGEQIFVGRWDAEKEEMDETAEEPSYGSA